VSKFEKIAEFSKKEIMMKQTKVETPVESDESDNDENETATATSVVIDESLPQDFFDSGVQLPVVVNKPSSAKQKSTNNESAKSAEDDTKAGTLPKGFFDDPKLDARSRKGPLAKDPIEEQMELFRKEIAQESIVSEVILEEEIEQLQKEKDITEVEEQLEKWETVEKYQKKIEEIHKKREEEKSTNKESESDSDDDEQDSLNDMNFWRSKGVFL